MTAHVIAFFFNLPGGPKWIIIGVVGLLIFGKKLPEVARSLGKNVVEFKKRLKAVEEEINNSGSESDKSSNQLPPTSNPYSSEAVAEPPPNESH
ncbi:MAG: twin-arginine translocase TatA/TatE family subunit [Phycisphaerae bacterium]|jgi:sec-independent protein translocase protein TatA|nr:twin-arginine translocase TatA/TatE family subunit [Phycisphaerae bacterium]